jgi:integrase
MAADSPTQLVERALRRCDLLDENGRPLVSLHGLRHTAGSIMLAAGVPLIVVSRQLGHANPQITAQVYAHLLTDEQLDIAAGALEALLATDTVRDTVRDDAPTA